jgi:hypothetical protein
VNRGTAISVKELHEGKYVSLWEAPETILEVVDWETEIIELPRSGNWPVAHVTGETVVRCRRVLGPGLDADQIVYYVRHGKQNDQIRLGDLVEPNPMLVIAYVANQS